MKVVWEEGDVRPGRRVGKPQRQERWMIGYDAGMGSGPRYSLVSLNDGMSTNGMTREALAAKLNDAGEFPEELLGPEERGRSIARG